MLGVAVKLQTAPSFMLLGKGKSPQTVKWSMKDRLLFASVLRLQEEKCPQCGTPIWWGHSYNSVIDFEVDYSVCHGCEALDEEKKDHKAQPGEYPHVHAVHVDGPDHALPSRDKGYSTIEKPARS